MESDPSVPGCAGCKEWSEQHSKFQTQVAALRKRAKDLEARVGRDSSNSSKPTSSDSPYRRSPPQSPSGNNHGGQPYLMR